MKTFTQEQSEDMYQALCEIAKYSERESWLYKARMGTGDTDRYAIISSIAYRAIAKADGIK